MRLMLQIIVPIALNTFLYGTQMSACMQMAVVHRCASALTPMVAACVHPVRLVGTQRLLLVVSLLIRARQQRRGYAIHVPVVLTSGQDNIHVHAL